MLIPVHSFGRASRVLSRDKKWIVYHTTICAVEHVGEHTVPLPLHAIFHSDMLLGRGE